MADSSKTAFRKAVAATLEAALGIPFKGGIIEGPVEDRSVGCTWTAGVREWADDVNLEEIIVQARVLKQWRQQQGMASPSITDLENLAEQVQLALKPVQTTLGPWQFRLSEIEIELATSSVLVTISALQANVFAMGG